MVRFAHVVHSISAILSTSGILLPGSPSSSSRTLPSILRVSEFIAPLLPPFAPDDMSVQSRQSLPVQALPPPHPPANTREDCHAVANDGGKPYSPERPWISSRGKGSSTQTQHKQTTNWVCCLCVRCLLVILWVCFGATCTALRFKAH